MANERYKVLKWMLELKEFTIAELSERSGVNKSTVYTFVRRHRGELLELDKIGTGRRGGAPVRFKVRADDKAALREELEAITAPVESASPLPDDALAALEILKKEYPRAADDARRAKLLRMARQYVRSASDDADPGERSYKLGLECLADVIDGYTEAARIDAPARAMLEKLCHRLLDTVPPLWERPTPAAAISASARRAIMSSGTYASLRRLVGDNVQKFEIGLFDELREWLKEAPNEEPNSARTGSSLFPLADKPGVYSREEALLQQLVPPSKPSMGVSI
jgi:hypothetical protein